MAQLFRLTRFPLEMKFLKRALSSFLCAAVLCFQTAALTGCVFDLGEFEDEEEYLESFGTVSLKSLSATRTFEVGEDFYTPAAMEHFESHVPEDEYVAFVLPIERDMNVDEIRLCINAPENVNVEIYMYVGDIETPPFYDAFDEEGAEPSAMPTDFVAKTSVSCVKDEWGYFSFADFLDGDRYEDTVELEDGDVLTFVFLNNTAWGKDLGLQNCGFSLTALLVRAV